MKRRALTRLTLVGVLAAMGLTSLVVPAHAAKSRAVSEVTFWTAYTGGLGKAFSALATQYEQSHHVKVNNVVTSPYGSLFTKEQSAVFAGGVPQGGQAYENIAASLVKNGAITRLEQFVHSKKNGLSKKDIADFPKGIWNDTKLGGHQYMWPLSKSDIVLFYNPAMLKAAGINKPPSTWAQFAADSKKLTKGPSSQPTQWGSTFEVSESTWYAWMKEWGVPILGKNHKPVFASKKGMAPVNFFVNLAKKHYIFFRDNSNGSYPGEADFDAGKAAFYVGTSAGYTFVKAAAKPGVQVLEAAMPAGPKRRATEMFGANMVIFSNNTNAEKAAAWNFLKWATEPAQTAYWAINTGYMPVRKSAFKVKELKDYYAANPSLDEAAKQLNYAVVEPAFPQWTKMQADITTGLLSALSLSRPAAQAMKDAQTQATADLKSH
jgi:multiple sugar transport system substrate-binding protein